MNAQVVLAFDVLMVHEGGFSPEDNGRGAVNFGVTQATLDDLKTRGAGWASLPVHVQDLTRNQVFDIFRDAFWFPSGAFRIKDQKLATAYSNLFYNSWTAATKALQRAVGVEPDGSFGPLTERAVNSRDPGDLLREFKSQMLSHYAHLARENPAKYGDDLKGWKRRLDSLCGED